MNDFNMRAIDNIKLENLIKEKGLTKTAFCKLAKISTKTLNKILKDEDFRLDALEKIIKVLRVPIVDLIYKSQNT